MGIALFCLGGIIFLSFVGGKVHHDDVLLLGGGMIAVGFLVVLFVKYLSGEVMPFPEDDAGMQAFLSVEETILEEDVVITYFPTGISKTYVKGTAFPSSLKEDWETGYFQA